MIRALAAGSLVALAGGVIPGAALAATVLPRLAQPAAVSARPRRLFPQASSSRAGWYVVIDGEQVGPLSDEAVMRRLDRGEITPDTLIWRAGMEDWQAISANQTIMAKRVAVAIGRAKPATPLDGKFGRTI